MKTNYWSNLILSLLRGTPYNPPPGGFYMGLFTAAPNVSYTGGAPTGTEPAIGTNGYARAAITLGAPVAGVISNSTPVTFPTASGSWGTQVDWGIFDGPTLGANLLYFDALGTNEAQTVTISGGVSGGTFTLSFGGQTTAAIAWNASALTVQGALENLTSIGEGNVVVTGALGGPWTITFQGTLGDAAQVLLTHNIASLTGGTPAMTHAEVTAGVAGNVAVGANQTPSFAAGALSLQEA